MDIDIHSFANTLIETSRASWKSLLKEPSTEHRDKSTLWTPLSPSP